MRQAEEELNLGKQWELLKEKRGEFAWNEWIGPSHNGSPKNLPKEEE